MAAAAGFLATGGACTDGPGLDGVDLIAGNNQPAATLGPGRAQPEHVEPAALAGGRRLDPSHPTHDADKVYDSVDGLAASWHASMAALTAMPEFHAWQLSKPAL